MFERRVTPSTAAQFAFRPGPSSVKIALPMSGPSVDEQLEALVRQFSKLVRSVAARVGGTAGRELADDVEQQVFLNLWKQLKREQIIENPSSYIYRCAVRETVRLLDMQRVTE